jgi:hypothetical protein
LALVARDAVLMVLNLSTQNLSPLINCTICGCA